MPHCTAPFALSLLVAGLAGCAREPPSPPPPGASASSPSGAPSPAATTSTDDTGGAPVTLALNRVSIERSEHHLLIRCDATLNNRTGSTLHVATNFNSVFDGIDVVVASEQGQELARQAYIYHQSPYAEDQHIPLAPGKTSQTIGFPVTELKSASGAVRVKLVGGLRGTAYPSGLVSNEVRAVLEESKNPPP